MSILSYCPGCGGSIEADSNFHYDGEPGDDCWHQECWEQRPGKQVTIRIDVVLTLTGLS
jgi:hypothetical protein